MRRWNRGSSFTPTISNVSGFIFRNLFLKSSKLSGSAVKFVMTGSSDRICSDANIFLIFWRNCSLDSSPEGARMTPA